MITRPKPENRPDSPVTLDGLWENFRKIGLKSMPAEDIPACQKCFNGGIISLIGLMHYVRKIDISLQEFTTILDDLEDRVCDQMNAEDELEQNDG